MSQRVILITGGSSGIGYYCAQHLVAKGGSVVIIASRTPPNVDLGNSVSFIPLDLSSRTAIEQFVTQWSYGPLDQLILNAGMISGPDITFDHNGIETTFSVNYLNQAYLFLLLHARGLIGPSCRSIFLTTALHDPNNAVKKPPAWTDPDNVAHATDKRFEDPMTRYSTAKLAVIFFVYYLHNRILKDTSSLEVVAYEPGFSPGGGSKLGRAHGTFVMKMVDLLAPVLRFVFGRMGVVVSTPQNSGRLMAELACKIGRFADMDINGKYVLLDRLKDSSDESYDVTKQEELWKWTLAELHLDGLAGSVFGSSQA